MSDLDLAATKDRLASYARTGPPAEKAFEAAWLASRVPGLIAEVERLRGQLAAIRDLHTDSTAGPCPVCCLPVTDDTDGLVDWPCPTLRAMGVVDTPPGGVR